MEQKGDNNMSITIRRSTGWMGMASLIQILVNGEKLAAINENQSMEIEIPDDKANLMAKQFGVKSNVIEVRDGDILEIKRTQWHRMIFPLMIAIQISLIFIPSLAYRLMTLLSFSVLIIISIFFIKGFYIENINREN